MGLRWFSCCCLALLMVAALALQQGGRHQVLLWNNLPGHPRVEGLLPFSAGCFVLMVWIKRGVKVRIWRCSMEAGTPTLTRGFPLLLGSALCVG